MNSIKELFSQEGVQEIQFDIESIKTSSEKIMEIQSLVGGRATLMAKVAAGGVNVFEFVHGNSSSFALADFKGVIVAHHKSNALFSGNDMKKPPVCSSTDGINGVNRLTGEYIDCLNCKYNDYGTADNGVGKACKNMHRLYILVEGCPVPVILSLPPTSLENWKNYILMNIAAKGFDISDVVTEFSLEKEINRQGKPYSIVKFKLVGKVDDEVRRFCTGMKRSIENAPRIEITAAEYNREPLRADTDLTGISEASTEQKTEPEIESGTEPDPFEMIDDEGAEEIKKIEAEAAEVDFDKI